MSNRISNIREFEDFRLMVEEKQLCRGNDVIELPEKVIDVLIALTEDPGTIKKKEDLACQIWSEAKGADRSLTNAVHILRKTFREWGHDDLIKTIPRRGYRFVGEVSGDVRADLVSTQLEVSLAESDAGYATEPAIQKAKPIELIDPGQRTRYRWIVAGGLLVAIFAVAGLTVWNYRDTDKGSSISHFRSLAVLPLRAAGDEDEGLRMRITDSVITRLSEVERIRVRPTAIVQQYIDTSLDPVSAGRELMVDAVFDGTVELQDAILSVELRAISTSSGEQIWSDRFVGEPHRLLTLQDSISERILALLRSGAPGVNRLALARNPTQNTEAYENYLKGRFFWQKRTPDGLKNAISFFQRAIELDDQFAEAFVGLADSYYLIYDYNYDRSKENVRKAVEKVDRAIEIDAENAQAHVTLGLIKTTHEWDWEGAARAFETALQLRPESADAFHRRGMLRLKLGDFTSGEADLRRAAEIEPTSIGINMNLGLALYYSGKNQDAIRHFRSSIERDERLNAPRWYLARCIWQTGDRERSFMVYLEALEASGEGELADRLRERSRSEPLEMVLEYWINEWTKAGVTEHSRAILSSHRKDAAGTLALLKGAVESRHPWATSINAEPEFKFLRDEPEFKELLVQLGF